MTTNKLAITEVVLRDAHQSLFATRLRLDDMLPIAEKLDQVGFWSLETWGGATFDACIRFLGEDPWERLRLIKKEKPDVALIDVHMPGMSGIELTERIIVTDPVLAQSKLSELKMAGFSIALDDFGTAESRLGHLYRYPIDTLKIDGSVVAGAAESRDNEAVIAAAVAG